MLAFTTTAAPMTFRAWLANEREGQKNLCVFFKESLVLGFGQFYFIFSLFCCESDVGKMLIF